jgi:rod shape-determining protein MreC
MTVDRSTRLLEPLRESIVTMLTPVTVLSESPYLLGRSAVDTLASREALEAQLETLEAENLVLSHLAQQYRVLREENDRLLALAGSRARLPVDVLAAEIIGIVPAANSHQVIVDKGLQNGVEKGQAVIDASGLFGQVVESGRYTSRVLLVADKDHAVPVEINRNGVRSVAGGSGRIDRLELEFVPVTTDIKTGDLVVTSGLGGRFPRGYPVGEVMAVSIDPNSSFAVVSVRPAAQLDRSRHVLITIGPIPEVPHSLEAPGPGTPSTPGPSTDDGSRLATESDATEQAERGSAGSAAPASGGGTPQ